MRYTIEGFSQAKAVELGLCVADLIILRWFIDFTATDRMIKREIEGKEYYWVKYEGILSDLPILSITKDTLYRRLKGLVDVGVLEHITLKEAGTYSLYKTGENYARLIDDSYELSEKNPTGYGKKSDRGTEKNPYQNTNQLNNKKSLPKGKEEQAPSTPKKSYTEVFNAPENEHIKEALVKFINVCKGRNIKFQYKTLERWAKTLRDNAGTDKELAMAIVEQSIDKGWKDLYPLKNTGKNAYVKKEAVSIPVSKEDKATNEDGSYTVF